MSIEELREQQAEEMREVENYVEHIRSLSDEREALTLEFEAENEQLKADVVRLTNALEGTKCTIHEYYPLFTFYILRSRTVSSPVNLLFIE